MHDIFKAYRGFTNQGLLTEALEDLGLSDKIVNYIRNSFDDRVSEKALTWYGSLLKKDQKINIFCTIKRQSITLEPSQLIEMQKVF